MAGPAFSIDASFVRPFPNGGAQLIGDGSGQIAPGFTNLPLASNRLFDTSFATSNGITLSYVRASPSNGVGAVDVIGNALDVAAMVGGAPCLLHLSWGSDDGGGALGGPMFEAANVGPWLIPNDARWTFIGNVRIVTRFVLVWLENVGSVSTTSWQQWHKVRDGVS